MLSIEVVIGKAIECAFSTSQSWTGFFSSTFLLYFIVHPLGIFYLRSRPSLILILDNVFLSVWMRNTKGIWAMGWNCCRFSRMGVLPQAWAWRAWQLSCWQFGWGYSITIWPPLANNWLHLCAWLNTWEHNFCNSNLQSSSCHQSSDSLPL